jgi:hypothetical protein
VVIEWVYFENDVAAANHNCINDPRRMGGVGRAKLNDGWTRCYTIPAGHKPQPITRIEAKKTAGS